MGTEPQKPAAEKKRWETYKVFAIAGGIANVLNLLRHLFMG